MTSHSVLWFSFTVGQLKIGLAPRLVGFSVWFVGWISHGGLNDETRALGDVAV